MPHPIRESRSPQEQRSGRRKRCGKCEACTRPDCGKCNPCKGKTKFGGDGSSHDACIARRCLNLYEGRTYMRKNKKKDSNESTAAAKMVKESTATTTAKTIASSQAKKPKPKQQQLKKPPPTSPSNSKKSKSTKGNSSNTSNKRKRTSASSAASSNKKVTESSSQASVASSLNQNTSNNGARASRSTGETAISVGSYGFKLPPTNRKNLQWGHLASPPSIFDGPQFPLYKKDKSTPTPKRTPKLIHGLPVPPPPKEGVCAECQQANPDDDPASILLCDGPNCGREYHLQCCIPPLESVPDGDFFCFNCSPKGTTAILEQFLEDHERQKDNKETVYPKHHSFREYLIERDLQEENNGYNTKVPVSELWEYHLNPEKMIGKPVRIYCAPGNSYYSGRIIQVRRDSEHFSDTCCLVRFPAGQDYRKVPLTTWIHLEEHCVAVGTRLIWGLFEGDQWKPAIVWSRSARELVPVVPLLSVPLGQIQFALSKERHTKTDPLKVSWCLAECFGVPGVERYELLKFDTDTKDFLSTSNPALGDVESQSGDAEWRQLKVNLALAELREQERVEHWDKLPMRNPLHKQVLQCRDEYTLGPLRYEEEEPSTIQPTPLEIEGLDRAYLLEQLCASDEGVDRSRDVAASLQCELVDFVPGTIQMLTAQDRRRQVDTTKRST